MSYVVLAAEFGVIFDPLKGYTRDGSHWSGWAKELIELTDGKAQLAICRKVL